MISVDYLTVSVDQEIRNGLAVSSGWESLSGYGQMLAGAAVI